MAMVNANMHTIAKKSPIGSSLIGRASTGRKQNAFAHQFRVNSPVRATQSNSG
jgi:hypothetical protein